LSLAFSWCGAPAAEETGDRRARIAQAVEPLACVPAIMNIAQKGYQFVAEVGPREQDILLPKKHPSAFFGTPLASYLINARADTIVVTGCTTSGCVRGTVVDGFAYNFRALVPYDAVYDRSATSHAVNLFDMASKYADVLSTDEALVVLGGLKAAA
jgi:maleamate amidohydrolase